MRTRDLRDDQGQLIGFQMSNTLVSRRGVGRIAATVPHVRVMVRPTLLGLFGNDVFCEFDVGHVRFVAWEPFGDSDCYWIATHAGTPAPEVDVVRAAFERVVPLFYLF
jgi:hypothetical protein